MANGMLSPSLFVDSNNSDFDNSYTLAPATIATGAASTLGGGWCHGTSLGIWKGDWRSGRKLAGVINPTLLVYLLSGATARVAHLAAGYPVLPHWSWLFDYCWPNFTDSKQFTAVYQAGEKSGGGHQDVVRTLPVTWPLPVDQSDSQGIGYLTFLLAGCADITQIEPLLRQAATGTVPAALGVASGDDQSVIDAATDWVSEFDSFALSTAPSADTWQPSRLEHQFAITAGSPAGTPFQSCRRLLARQAAGLVRLRHLGPGRHPGAWQAARTARSRPFNRHGERHRAPAPPDLPGRTSPSLLDLR